jgi:MOSC domain-containing protein YiiM
VGRCGFLARVLKGGGVFPGQRIAIHEGKQVSIPG